MEIFGTALLTYVVFGVAVDKHATRTVSHMAPLAIGFTVFICHMMLVCHPRGIRERCWWAFDTVLIKK
jgi:glycerol uptake facilitator-like aquaporin